jgi:hypothetical protein
MTDSKPSANLIYNNKYFGELVYDWVNTIHSTLTKEYDMKKFKIEANDFGFDSYASIIDIILSNITPNEIFDSIKGNRNINKFICLSHKAWCYNYIHWKNKEYDQISRNPKKSINTVNRNNRATSSVEHLTNADIEMYVDVINTIFTILENKILNASMQQLAL